MSTWSDSGVHDVELSGTIRHMHRVAVSAAALLVALASACSSDTAYDESASTATARSQQPPSTATGDVETASTTESAPTEWVAVYRTEPHPEPERTQFIAEAGQYVCECVVSCFPGLDTQLGVNMDTYFLGLVADTAEELEQAQGKVAGEPTFVGELPSLCGG
jgi:hypothetical protein